MIRKPGPEELEMFRRVMASEPKFYEYCVKQRDWLLAGLEQADSDRTRGQSLLLRDFISYLKPPTR